MGTADNKANSQWLELMSGVSSECDTSTNEVRITLCDAFMENYELNLLIHQSLKSVVRKDMEVQVPPWAPFLRQDIYGQPQPKAP